MCACHSRCWLHHIQRYALDAFVFCITTDNLIINFWDQGCATAQIPLGHDSLYPYEKSCFIFVFRHNECSSCLNYLFRFTSMVSHIVHLCHRGKKNCSNSFSSQLRWTFTKTCSITWALESDFQCSFALKISILLTDLKMSEIIWGHWFSFFLQRGEIKPQASYFLHIVTGIHLTALTQAVATFRWWSSYFLSIALRSSTEWVLSCLVYFLCWE